jgi:hypothetical protein
VAQFGSHSFPLLSRSAESVSHPEEASPEEQPEEAGAEASAEEEQLREAEEEEEAEAVEYLAELPEPLLLRVLAELPATELVQACRLVCLRWKELVDGAPLWLLKCQQEGLVPEGSADEERDHWQQFYFLSKRRRNLLRNPCGEGEGRIIGCPPSLLENGPRRPPASRLNEMKRLVHCLAQSIPLLPGESLFPRHPLSVNRGGTDPVDTGSGVGVRKCLHFRRSLSAP